MMGKRYFFAATAFALVGLAEPTWAAPSMTLVADTGIIVSDTHPPQGTFPLYVDRPYSSPQVTVTPVTAGWKVIFATSPSFRLMTNNLAGGKTEYMDGLISFDIEFDAPLRLSADVVVNGAYTTAGNGRVLVTDPDLPAGIYISQLDGGPIEDRVHAFYARATTAFNAGAHTWSLEDNVSGFSKAYKKYHIAMDLYLFAESLEGAPGFAAISVQDVSFVFSPDLDFGGGPLVPEPASLGLFAVGAGTLLLRGRK